MKLICRLSNVTLETAIFISGSTNNLAIGVETCRCSEMYEGSSCQNPGDGYYRFRETIIEPSHLQYDYYVGKSVACQCNGRSNRCNKETGYCEVNMDENCLFINFLEMDCYNFQQLF